MLLLLDKYTPTFYYTLARQVCIRVSSQARKSSLSILCRQEIGNRIYMSSAVTTDLYLVLLLAFMHCGTLWVVYNLINRRSSGGVAKEPNQLII